MDNFIVSARKYRPTTFDTVVGQTSITATLKNAIKNEHLAQAFLFCGPRGVGKTTCARILAKTINCFNRSESIEACNECDSCLSFNEGHSLNIYELDAASNNSVDDIRNLIDQVRLAPQLGTHKVYIIDEVHMLSQAAFNAFLKTLEEPPAHAIFILATTEKHKIIPTILSRCQIFDFNRIQIPDISGHLVKIAQLEQINAEPDALHIIAQKADGALRDALSIFDQIVSFSGNNITYQAVIDNLNILDYDYYFKVTDALVSGDIPSGLLIFNEILNKGFDGHNFINGLGEHFRNLLVCKDASTIKLLEVGDNIKKKYAEQSNVCEQGYLLKGLSLISKCDVQYKASKNPRLLVELTVMQLCSINSLQEKKNDTPVVIKAAEPVKSAAKPQQQTETKPTTQAPTTSPAPPTSAPEPAQEMATPAQEAAAPAKVPIENTVVPEQPPVEKVVEQQPQPVKHIPPQNNGVVAKENPPKTILKGDPLSQYNTTILSINEVAKEKEAADAELEEDLSNKPRTPFTPEQLKATWDEYATIIKEQGKKSFHSTLTLTQPVLKEDFLVELTIANAVQEKDFDREKSDLVAFIRQKLNNYGIQLQTTLAEKVTVEHKTPKEQFKEMAQSNPSLIKLYEQLDLDVDY